MCGDKFYRAQLTGLWIETLFYGFNVAVFAGSVYVLTHHRRSKYYLATSISVFILCTTDMLLDLLSILLARDATANSDIIQDTVLSCTSETRSRLEEAIREDLLLTVRDAVNGMAMFIADALLITRCFILWQHKRWIVYPLVFLLLATLACIFATVYYDAAIYHIRVTTPLSEDSLPEGWAKNENLYFVMSSTRYAFTLVTNVLATLCISFRVWSVKRELQCTLGKAGGSKHYDAAIAIIIESGAVLSISFMIALICIYTTPLYSIIASNVAFQLVGIAPTMIIIRVGLASGIESEAPVQLSDQAPRSNATLDALHSIRFAEREHMESSPWTPRSPVHAESATTENKEGEVSRAVLPHGPALQV
ncbi:hypothetical protein DENSPDRAFT_838462 [Dentipellis sp. KUC8613]|nr:hypothetical protein DENSPDRAFT_838462 [Dentipellis sp. KUC8613]